MQPLEFTFPLRTKTGLNAREHFAVRAKRVKLERLATRAAFLAAMNSGARNLLIAHAEEHGAQITLTRIGPRRVDDDGVVGGCKGVRDEIADCLGLDDGDERLRWRYGCERGAFAVRVRIEALDACCPECGRPWGAAALMDALQPTGTP
jgi:hypothetical protein